MLFFTVVTDQPVPLFAGYETVALFLGCLDDVRTRHPFDIVGIVVLPEHIHAMWQLPDGDLDYPGRWRLVKSAFTRRYLKQRPPPSRSASRATKGEQSVWQRRYWEHLLRDDADFDAHLDYIHFNPVRHGLVSVPYEYPHSTFRDWVDRGRYEPTWGSNEIPKFPDTTGRE